MSATYSAERVHAGQKRGDTEVIDAVILVCDLRGSLILAEHYDLKGFLGGPERLLRDHRQRGAEGGGEVLHYVSEASLAIFPFERYADKRAAC